jgi:hypothetical protein
MMRAIFQEELQPCQPLVPFAQTMEREIQAASDVNSLTRLGTKSPFGHLPANDTDGDSTFRTGRSPPQDRLTPAQEIIIFTSIALGDDKDA